jgi:hypothetical protein
MANEAAITIIGRMRDEISDKMGKVSTTTKTTDLTMREFKMSLMAVGSALTATGSLINRIDNPLAKTAATWLLTAGAIISTTSAIFYMIPQIKALITMLRGLAVIQTIVKALSGPIGWAQVGIGLGIAAAGTAAIYGMTRGMGGGNAQGGQTININAQAFAGNTAEARKFASKIQRYSREETRLGR